MEVCRFTIGQLTPHARGEVYTTLASLPQGLVSDASQPALRIAGAVSGQTVAVHYTRQGLKWPDGSWRQARIQFYALLDAGAPGVRGYEHAFERELVLEVGTGSIGLPGHEVHPAVQLSQLRFEFQTQMQGIGINEIGNTFGDPGPVRTWRIDPLQSTWRELTSPWPEQTAARTELPHSAAAGGSCYVRQYQVNARLLPEGEDQPDPAPNPVDVTEPSLCARLTYEVVDSLVPGAARKVRFWLEIANTLTTSVEDPRAPNYNMGRWLSPPKARIYTADPSSHPIEVALYGEDALLPSAPKVLTENDTELGQPIGIEWDLTDFDENADNANRDEDRAGYNSFHDGMSRVYQGAIYFTGGAALTAIEQSTLNAMEHAPAGGTRGEDCVCYAVPRDLNRFRTFGAFGVVPSVDDPGFGWNIEDLRNRTAALSRQYRDEYRERDPWTEQRLSTPKNTKDAGAQRGQGAITAMQWAMTGHWDLRAWWISCSQEAFRWWHFRYLDGTSWSYDDMRRVGTPTSWASSAHFNACRPFYAGQSNTHPDPPISSPSWFHNLGKWGTVVNTRRLVNGYDISTPRGLNDNSTPGRVAEGWRGHNFQHFVINNLIAMAHLSADTWLLDSEWQHQVNITLCTRQVDTSSLENGAFVNTELGVAVPRSEGRINRHRAHVLTLVNDESVQSDFFDRFRDRSEAALYWGTTVGAPGSNKGDRDQDLLDELAEVSRDNNGYWTNNNKFFLANGTTPAWSAADGQADSYAPWHIGLLQQGWYAMELLSAFDPDATRRAETQTATRQLGEYVAPSCILNGAEFVDSVTGWRFYYAVPADIPYLQRGAAPPQSAWGQTYPGGVWEFFRGSLREVTGFGPPIPGSSGIPWFQRGGADLGTKWPFSTVQLAPRYAPNDSDVEARAIDMLQSNPLMPTGQALLEDFFNATAPWVQHAAIVPNQFDLPASQSRGIATMPSPRAAGQGAVTGGSVAGAGVASMPTPTARAAGTAVQPTVTGTAVASMPSPSVVAVGATQAATVSGTAVARIASPRAVGAGSARLVINAGEATLGMPQPTAAAVARVYPPVPPTLPEGVIATPFGGAVGSFAVSSYGEPASVVRGTGVASISQPILESTDRFDAISAHRRDLVALAHTAELGETVLYIPRDGGPAEPVRAIVERPEPFGSANGRVVTTIQLLLPREQIEEVVVGEDQFQVEVFIGSGRQRCRVTNVVERAATHWYLEVHP